jgi:hypothetical protein
MQRDEGCHVEGLGRKRDFIVATYRIETTGDWTTEIPTAAPCGPGCRLRAHDERERLTGPGHPLLVVKCTVHGAYFTVYPPGFLPFSRRPLVPRGQRWEETMFEAAIDAAKGERQSDIGEQGSWWSTQWRHILRLGLLLGLVGDDRVGQEAAQGLGIDLHLHLGARVAFGKGGFRRRGGAITKVLEAVRSAGADRLRRLLRTGFLTGFCGRCFWSDPRFGLTPVGAF